MAKVARKSPQAQLSPADAELENKILNYFLLFFSCALIGWLWEVAISFALELLFYSGAFVSTLSWFFLARSSYVARLNTLQAGTWKPSST